MTTLRAERGLDEAETAPFRSNDELLNLLPKGVIAFPGSRITDTRLIVVLQQDTVLRGLKPMLDPALGLGMVRCAADVTNTLIFKPVHEITTFDFLGFTHVRGRSRQDKDVVRQITAKGRFAHVLKSVHDWCKKYRHLPIKARREHLPGELSEETALSL